MPIMEEHPKKNREVKKVYKFAPAEGSFTMENPMVSARSDAPSFESPQQHAPSSESPQENASEHSKGSGCGIEEAQNEEHSFLFRAVVTACGKRGFKYFDLEEEDYEMLYGEGKERETLCFPNSCYGLPCIL